MKKCIWILAVLAILSGVPSAVQAQVIEDDFNDGVLDLTKWTPLLVFGNSDLTESGGVLTFKNRGRITANASYPTAEISGRFQFAATGGNQYEVFSVVVRTTGGVGTAGGPVDGIFIHFLPSVHPDTTDEVRVSQIGPPRIVLDGTNTSYSIDLGTFYDFRITDDGSEICVYLIDLTTPALCVSTAYDPGDMVAIHNRDPVTADYYTDLDHIRIAPFAGEIVRIYGAVELEVTTENLHVYQLQYSVDSASWEDLGGPFLGNGESMFFFDSTRGPVPRKHYRAVEY